MERRTGRFVVPASAATCGMPKCRSRLPATALPENAAVDRMDATAPFSSTGPHGHRGRMRSRLLAAEAALADYEILEMLLFLGIPRRDTKPLAKSLINRFGSLAATLEAGRDALLRTGLPERAIEALALATEAAAYLARPERIKRAVLGNWAALEAHLDIASRTRQPAGVSVLLLNNRNQLLGEPAWEPGVDSGRLATEMLRHALDQHATAAILVRNRAGADARLGPDDHAFYAAVQRAAAALSVTVHDLVVIGRGDWASLRQRGRS